MSADFTPQAKLPKLTGKGEAALAGAAKGFGIGLLGGVGCFLTAGYVPELCLVALFTPVFIVGQAIEEAKKWTPEPVVQQAKATLEYAVHQWNIQETMRAHVARVARSWTGQTFAPLDLSGPGSVEEDVNYKLSADQGIDTVLEISVLTIGLKPGPDAADDEENLVHVNPGLVFDMTVRTRLIRLADGPEIVYDHIFAYSGSSSVQFTAWADDDAQMFRGELGYAYETVAGQIVQALLLPDPERNKTMVTTDMIPRDSS